MTRAERERLIQSYLSGEMSSAEESDFFIQVALDKELRQDLKAQRTIESAFRKDRESEPSEHTALRSRVAMSLAASSASLTGPAQAPVGGEAAGAGRLGRLLTGPGRWIIASTAALVLTVGVMIMLPDGPPSDAPVSAPAPTPGQLKNTSPSSAPGSVTAPKDHSPAPLPRAASGMENGAISQTDDSKSKPPASVSSDGVRPGSAAQTPRRTSQSFNGTSRRGDGPRSSVGGSLRRGSRSGSTRTSSSASSATSASTDTSTQSIGSNSTQPTDTRSVDSRRQRKLGGDSIDAGVRIQLKRPRK